MNKTLKMMNQITTKESKEMTLEQLAKEYQKELNPIYLATAYEKLFIAIIMKAKNFYGLTEDDIDSYALEELDYCLQSWNEEKKVKVSSYYQTLIYNRFRMETQALNTAKRKIVFNTEAIHDNYDKQEDKILYLEEYGLSKKEEEFCKHILEGYTLTEISRKMNMSVTSSYSIRKKLRIKFS